MTTVSDLNGAICRAFGIDPTRVKSLTLRLECDKLPECTVETFVIDNSAATEIVKLDLVAREPERVADVTGLGQRAKLWTRVPPIAHDITGALDTQKSPDAGA